MNTKTTLVVAIIAAALAVFVFISKPWEERAVEKPAGTTTQALFAERPANIDRVEVTVPGDKHPRRVFIKDGENWKMVEPIECPANKYEVDPIVEKIVGLNYVKAFTKGNKDCPDETTTGLGNPTATVKLLTSDQVKAEFTLGARQAIGKGSYVATGDGNTVYLVQDNIASTLTKRISSYRDKRLLTVELDDVANVEVTGLANFRLARDDDAWIIEEPTRGRADKARADRVGRGITNLYVREFVDDAPDSYGIYGLEKPRLSAKVTSSVEIPPKAKPGDPNTQPADTQPSMETRQYELLVGGTAEDKTYFARIAEAPGVFTISDHTVTELTPDLSDLREKSLAKIETSKVTRIEAQTPAGEMSLNREKGKWTFADSNPSDSAAVSDLLKTISDLKATDFIDPSELLIPLDWKNPRATVTITQEGQTHPTTLLVGPASASGKMVYVRNADEDAVAVVREEDVTQLLLGPASYRDRAVLSFPRDRADRIEITRAGNATVALAKDNNKWSMVEPTEAPADATKIRNLLQSLAALRAKAIVGEGNKANFGLDKPQVELAVHLRSLSADPNTKVVGEQKTNAPVAADQEKPAATVAPQRPKGTTTRAAADKGAASKPAAGMSVAELLEYTKSLPKEKQNPAAIKMLEEQLAQEGTQAATATQPATKKPAISIAELLEYQRSLPQEKQNPLATKMLEDMLAKEQATSTQTQPTSATTKPAATGMSIAELLEYTKSLPREKQNPLAIKMLEDMLAKEKAGSSTQPVVDKTSPQGMSIAELLEYTKSLPKEKQNPLAIKMLENMLTQQSAKAPSPAQASAESSVTIRRLLLSQKDNKTYACLGGNDLIFELDNKVFEDATSEMHETKLASFEVSDAVELILSGGERELTFRKSGEDWKYVADPVLPIDAEKVKEVLNTFRDLNTHRYVNYVASDLESYGVGNNARRIAVGINDGQRTEVLLSDKGPAGDPDDSKYAVLAGTKKVFLLKAEQIAKFDKKLEDFEKSAQ